MTLEELLAEAESFNDPKYRFPTYAVVAANDLALRLKLAVWTLHKSHMCATLRDDGTCEGCYVSEAIHKIEEP